MPLQYDVIKNILCDHALCFIQENHSCGNAKLKQLGVF